MGTEAGDLPRHHSTRLWAETQKLAQRLSPGFQCQTGTTATQRCAGRQRNRSCFVQGCRSIGRIAPLWPEHRAPPKRPAVHPPPLPMFGFHRLCDMAARTTGWQNRGKSKSQSPCTPVRTASTVLNRVKRNNRMGAATPCFLHYWARPAGSRLDGISLDLLYGGQQQPNLAVMTARAIPFQFMDKDTMQNLKSFFPPYSALAHWLPLCFARDSTPVRAADSSFTPAQRAEIVNIMRNALKPTPPFCRMPLPLCKIRPQRKVPLRST